ncbi:MAG TPA: hypothetical protein VL949_12670 [Geobacteraceae bacterium]|nr:hypothetical protein [Geobacteraceae bacterium]
MGRMKLVGATIAMLALHLVIPACATVPPPQAQVKTAVLAKSGDTVQLFHGGNKLAKDEFCRNAVVAVYRYSQSNAGSKKSEVGKIRITGFVGDHYLEGVVVEGTLKDGDIAVQPNSACLIRMPDGVMGDSNYKIP